MATKSYYHDISLERVSELKNARIHNISTADRTTLGGSLSGTSTGLLVYDTDIEAYYFWDGSAWQAVSGLVSGAMTFKGVVAFDAAEPGSPAIGDYYVFSTAGTNTWNTSDVVQIGDSAIWDGSNWQFMQGNTLAASEAIAGVIEIATQSETNTGTDDTRAVTPAKLSSWATTKTFAKTYYSTHNLTANTPLTVTHNLSLQNRNAFTINVMDPEHSQISVDVDSVDANSLTLTSAVSITGAHVTIIGF